MFRSLTIAVLNDCFLYRRNTQWTDPQEKTIPLRTFQAHVASNLVSAKKKRNKGRPSAELKLTPLPSKSKCNQHHVRHKIGWNRSHAKLERKKRALTAMPQ